MGMSRYYRQLFGVEKSTKPTPVEPEPAPVPVEPPKPKMSTKKKKEATDAGPRT